MENNFDTICAIITPLALGAVGIIRISGQDSFNIARKIFSKDFEIRKINYGFIIDKEGKKLDEVILLPFKGPKSYTGEDVVEIQTHGSAVIINSILELIIEHGARIAQRGEFTKRAFLNHRIDLSQAEAVLDLIQSRSKKSAQGALSNLGGYLKNKINSLKEDLVKIYSKVIASIDFPEEVQEVDKQDIVSICNDKILEIETILKNAKSADFIKDGINLCLIGAPNVGKSSLFNCLLNYNRAIVTPIEGTTRDTIKETLNLEGYLINFIDTAGIRDKSKADEVEKIGIDNSIEAIKNSDIVLFLYENDKDEINQKLFRFAFDKKYLFIKTKSDINPKSNDKETIEISSKTGFGIEKLKKEIVNTVKNLIPNDTNYISNKRQQVCLNRALGSLKNVIETSKTNDIADFYAMDLKESILALDEITGEVLTDSILDNIFDNFCIGK